MWWLKSPERKFTIPDWFSIYRILAVPLLIALAISFSTDMIDGFLARKLKVESQRGAQLDSIGDALTFLMGIVGFVRFEWAFIVEQWLLLTVAIGLYLIQLGMAYWRYGMPSSFHTYLAKVSAVAQGIFLVWAFLIEIELWLFYVTVALGVIETIEEIILILKFSEWRSNVKGLFWVLKEKD